MFAKVILPVNGLPVLTSNNQRFVDPDDRTVILHGLNVMNKQYPFEPAAIGFNHTDIQFIKHYGFNVVRMGVFWTAVEPSPDHYNQTYLDNIKQLISELDNAGIYSLIDFHQDGYSEKTNGLGAPDWATLQEGNHYLETIGFPLSSFCNVSQPRSMPTCENWDNFWHDRPVKGGYRLQERYEKMLSFLVKDFQGIPGILGYDIMNEPFPGSSWPQCHLQGLNFSKGCYEFDTTTLTNFYNRMANAIHISDPTKIIFYEPLSLYGIGAPTYVGRINASNLGFSYHNYYNADLSLAFHNAKEQIEINDAVPFMTEFGASTFNPTQLTEIANLADSMQTSWVEWAYVNDPCFTISHFPGQPSDGRDQGIVFDLNQPLDDRNVRYDRLYAISRTYPQVVNGVIDSFKYNAITGDFSLKYKTNMDKKQPSRAKLYTIIYAPAFSYPNGKEVFVKGGTMVETPTPSQLIKIVNDDDALAVNIKITRKNLQHTIAVARRKRGFFNDMENTRSISSDNFTPANASIKI